MVHCTFDRPCGGVFGYACSDTYPCFGGHYFGPEEKAKFRLDDYRRGMSAPFVDGFTPQQWRQCCDKRTATVRYRNDYLGMQHAFPRNFGFEGQHQHGDECRQWGCGVVATAPVEVSADTDVPMDDVSVHSNTTLDSAGVVIRRLYLAYGTGSQSIDDPACVQCGSHHMTETSFVECRNAMRQWYRDAFERGPKVVLLEL